MVHHLQIIGEAVRSIDPDFRNKHPSVPWRLIAKNRNPEAPFAVAGRRMNSPGNQGQLFPEQPKQQCQNDTDNQASDDWEMKTEIAFCVINVSGQSSKPTFSDPRP
jgi:hypothetical protein